MANPFPLWEAGASPLFIPEYGQPVPFLQPFLVGERGRGAVVVCPGGGYYTLSPHEGAPAAEAINRAGVNAFVLSYRVQPYRWPAPLLDLQRAVRTIRHHAGAWGIDPEHVAVMGFSAGGHLAAMAATHPDGSATPPEDEIGRERARPDGLIGCYGATSFGAFRHSGCVENLLGRTELSPEEVHSLSAECRAGPHCPPAFLWHTAADASVPVENSLLLAEALHAAGVPCALHVFPYGRHGLGMAEEEPQARLWPELLNAWLLEQGY